MPNSREAKLEANRIGAAIKNTFDENAAAAWWWYPRAAAGNALGALLRMGHGEERCRGYFCWEWAYAFQDAFNLVDPEHFDVEVWMARTPDGRVHYWIEIISHETEKSVYVDDGFANGSNVHNLPPVPRGYSDRAQTSREADRQSGIRFRIPETYGPNKRRPDPGGWDFLWDPPWPVTPG